MLSTLLIDENIQARRRLKSLITTHFPELQIAGEANSIQAGSALIHRQSPEVIFLDIHLSDGTGFEFLEQFPNPDFQVIFTSVHEHFALKVLQYHALDFLPKPIDLEELKRIYCMIRRHWLPKRSSTEIASLGTPAYIKKTNRICLPTNEGLIFLSLNEIVRLESSGCYTTFHNRSGERIVVARTLKDFEKSLPSDTFFRIHQSHLVNIHFVRKILKQDGGYAILNDHEKIPISRRKKEAFVEKLLAMSL